LILTPVTNFFLQQPYSSAWTPPSGSTIAAETVAGGRRGGGEQEREEEGREDAGLHAGNRMPGYRSAAASASRRSST
jgi:hypothetical protein